MTKLTARTDRALRAHAKARILHWFDGLDAPAGARAELSRSIDRMFAELARRNDWFEVMTVALGDTENLELTLRARTWRAFPCGDLLAVCTVVPGWAVGWRSIIPDDNARDTLTWFLHYSRQYIHRSHVAKVLMAAWDKHARILHPFGVRGLRRYYAPAEAGASISGFLDAAQAQVFQEWGAPRVARQTRSRWSATNTLDPDLHQGIFHFLRAQSLHRQGFELEAVVAFDCVLQSLLNQLVRGKLATSATSRSALCETLGLAPRSGALADQAYFLRNYVGAHAGGWRWWDHGEITEDLLPALGQICRRALGRAAALEPSIRRIDPAPNDWSRWLLLNFDMLWDVMWFEKWHKL